LGDKLNKRGGLHPTLHKTGSHLGDALSRQQTAMVLTITHNHQRKTNEKFKPV